MKEELLLEVKKQFDDWYLEFVEFYGIDPKKTKTYDVFMSIIKLIHDTN